MDDRATRLNLAEQSESAATTFSGELSGTTGWGSMVDDPGPAPLSDWGLGSQSCPSRGRLISTTYHCDLLETKHLMLSLFLLLPFGFLLVLISSRVVVLDLPKAAAGTKHHPNHSVFLQKS